MAMESVEDIFAFIYTVFAGWNHEAPCLSQAIARRLHSIDSAFQPPR